MDFMEDTRGVSTIIGALFLFGFLVIAISINQAQVVPAQNAEIEAAHNQEVQNDLIAARSAIIEASYPQRDGTVTVTLGTRYPGRTFAVNPPPAAGRLATTANEELVVEDDGGGRVDVCAGSTSIDETRRLRYEPNYNEYTGPTTVYENTFLYNQQESSGGVGEARLTETATVFTSSDNAGTINLVALRNDYTEDGVGSTSVDFVSGETQRADGPSGDGVQDPTITLPTGVTNQPIWQAIVTQLDAKSGVDATLDSFTAGSTVTISFTGQYDILCTPVGVGGEPPSGASQLLPPGSGSGGGSTAASTVNLINPGTVSGDTSTVTFDLENTGSSSVTVSEISVDSTTDMQADKVERTGNEFIRTDGSGALDATLIIGDPETPLDTEATITAMSQGSFELGQFKKDTAGNPTRDMSGDDITITIVFGDGSSKQYTFTVP